MPMAQPCHASGTTLPTAWQNAFERKTGRLVAGIPVTAWQVPLKKQYSLQAP